MDITEKFNGEKTVYSFEIFPPKKTSPIETIYGTLESLADLSPDFISVTYGAAGTEASNTCAISSKIQNDYKIQSLAHITCVNNDKEQVDRVLQEFTENGIDNVLALRGDIVPDVPPKNDFEYANELVTHIKKKGNFYIAGACYPEVHPNAKNAVDDILNLKKKVDAGVSHLVTQLFFDNNAYYSFMEKIQLAGINVPVSAGIMPVVNTNQIQRMVSMCGASLPAKFTHIMQKFGSNPEALRDAGIAYAVEQIVDLIANGAKGIHLYTMNNPYVARKITEAVGNLL